MKSRVPRDCGEVGTKVISCKCHIELRKFACCKCIAVLPFKSFISMSAPCQRELQRNRCGHVALPSVEGSFGGKFTFGIVSEAPSCIDNDRFQRGLSRMLSAEESPR